MNFYGNQPPLERRSGGGLYRMTPEQQKHAEKLIRRSCCNWYQGNCLLLDDGETCACPQLMTGSVCCRWFRYVVLKNDPQLEDEIFGLKNAKRCVVCGAPFEAKSGRAKYCRTCRKKVRSIQASRCRQRAHGRSEC